MRILHIINCLSTAGAERLMVEMVPDMAKKGHKVDVIILNGKNTPFYQQLLDSKSCRIFPLGKSYFNPLYVFKIVPHLRNYDVIHVHLFPSQYFAVFAKWFSFSKAKFVFTEHCTSNRRLENKKYRWIEQLIYRNYETIICITDQVKEVLKEKLNIKDSKLVTIENGVNIQAIDNAIRYDKNDFGYAESDRILIMVAAFRNQKDHLTLLKALKYLPDHYKVILAGDGERRKQIESQVDQLQLKERVQLLGNRTDVYSLIKMADISILSSHWEGFGLAAVESMACEVPTIASDVPGLANVVNGGGLLFDKGNPEDLKSKILSLENKESYQQISQQGKIKARQFDINTMVDKILDVYQK